MATKAASAYRTVLRTLRNNVRSVKGNRDFESFVKSEFRRLAASGKSPEELQSYAELARDFAFLNQAIRNHKEILLSYNIGIDSDVRAKEGYRRAAHRVGLELPNYAPEKK